MSIPRISRPHERFTALSYANRLWIAIDSPISLGCYLRAKYREFKQLVEMEIDKDSYIDALSFSLDYQAIKLLSKYPYLETGIDTETVAKKKFIEAEVQCRQTNERFRTEGKDHFSGPVASIFYRAQRKIAFILGDVPEFSQMDFSFGPGAAYGVRGDTSVYKKVTANLECTHAFSGVLQQFVEEFPGWIPHGVQDVSLVPGSQLIIVPKNAKTGRPICIEPLLNGMYQKGVGSWIRKRLLRFGVNLNDQGINQKLASEAIDKLLATVDFSSASDMISYMLVLDLLPLPWFELLDVARCPRYQIDDNWYNFHKFTSMGNGYTFELESLIFYALACATCEELGIPFETGGNLSVYGDDVIIPRAAFDLFSEVSVACGFEISKTKSFYDGQFFESCGHDYFMGKYVRPLLLQEKLNTLPRAFYAANSVKRITSRFPTRESSCYRSSRVDSHPILIDRFRVLYDWVVGCIPPQLRCVGPEGYGDGHLIAGLPKEDWRYHPSWDGWWFYTYVESPIRVNLTEVPSGYALYNTRGHIDSVSEGSPLVMRDYVEVPRPPHNGRGYDLRGKTSLRRVKMFCHFQWLDVSWGHRT